MRVESPFGQGAGGSRRKLIIEPAERATFWQRFREAILRSPPASSFDHLVGFAHDVAARNPKALVEVMRMYLRPLQAELLVSTAANAAHQARPNLAPGMFFAPNAPPALWPSYRDQPRMQRESFCVDLTLDPVLPCPWHRDQYCKAITEIGSGKVKGVWRQTRNQKVTLFLPWGIPFVTGGNHSIAAGICHGEGRLTPYEVWDLQAWLDDLRTDGKHFYRTASRRPLCAVKDPVRAAIFEIGRSMRTHGIVPMLRSATASNRAACGQPQPE